MKTQELVSQVNFKEFERVFGKDYLNAMSPSERVAGLAPKDRVAGLAPKDRVVGLAPKDRVAGLPLEDRLIGLNIEDLEGLSIEEIKALLKKNKKG